jgi:glycyl-tRNA synthetase (class II)
MRIYCPGWNTDTLHYFMARTQLFMEENGLDPENLRFRQHLTTEMAHYATDCWDLEILTSYGWMECVGHAYHACSGLEVHVRYRADEIGVPLAVTVDCDTLKDYTVTLRDRDTCLQL